MVNKLSVIDSLILIFFVVKYVQTIMISTTLKNGKSTKNPKNESKNKSSCKYGQQNSFFKVNFL